jgi:hypothetical protein
MGTRLIVNEDNPLVVVRASGAPGRTIISGEGNPPNNLGVPGDSGALKMQQPIHGI